MKILKERKRRSEKLSKEEHKAFVKLFNSYEYKQDAADAFGLSRQVLDLVAIKGSGHPNTIKVIKEKLEKEPA